MSLNERDRLAMFRQVESGQITLVEASRRLSISYRQAKRLWKRYRQVGDAGLAHGLRGRPSNNQAASDARRERALALYREHYRGFGPTLAAEQMGERDGLVVDHETLRGWLIGSGQWKARRQPRRSHRRRPRRSCTDTDRKFDSRRAGIWGLGGEGFTPIRLADLLTRAKRHMFATTPRHCGPRKTAPAEPTASHGNPA